MWVARVAVLAVVWMVLVSASITQRSAHANKYASSPSGFVYFSLNDQVLYNYGIEPVSSTTKRPVVNDEFAHLPDWVTDSTDDNTKLKRHKDRPRKRYPLTFFRGFDDDGVVYTPPSPQLDFVNNRLYYHLRPPPAQVNIPYVNNYPSSPTTTPTTTTTTPRPYYFREAPRPPVVVYQPVKQQQQQQPSYDFTLDKLPVPYYARKQPAQTFFVNAATTTTTTTSTTARPYIAPTTYRPIATTKASTYRQEPSVLPGNPAEKYFDELLKIRPTEQGVAPLKTAPVIAAAPAAAPQVQQVVVQQLETPRIVVQQHIFNAPKSIEVVRTDNKINNAAAAAVMVAPITGPKESSIRNEAPILNHNNINKAAAAAVVAAPITGPKESSIRNEAPILNAGDFVEVVHPSALEAQSIPELSFTHQESPSPIFTHDPFEILNEKNSNPNNVVGDGIISVVHQEFQDAPAPPSVFDPFTLELPIEPLLSKPVDGVNNNDGGLTVELEYVGAEGVAVSIENNSSEEFFDAMLEVPGKILTTGPRPGDGVEQVPFLSEISPPSPEKQVSIVDFHFPNRPVEKPVFHQLGPLPPVGGTGISPEFIITDESGEYDNSSEELLDFHKFPQRLPQTAGAAYRELAPPRGGKFKQTPREVDEEESELSDGDPSQQAEQEHSIDGSHERGYRHINAEESADGTVDPTLGVAGENLFEGASTVSVAVAEPSLLEVIQAELAHYTSSAGLLRHEGLSFRQPTPTNSINVANQDQQTSAAAKAVFAIVEATSGQETSAEEGSTKKGSKPKLVENSEESVENIIVDDEAASLLGFKSTVVVDNEPVTNSVQESALGDTGSDAETLEMIGKQSVNPSAADGELTAVPVEEDIVESTTVTITAAAEEESSLSVSQSLSSNTSADEMKVVENKNSTYEDVVVTQQPTTAKTIDDWILENISAPVEESPATATDYPTVDLSNVEQQQPSEAPPPAVSIVYAPSVVSSVGSILFRGAVDEKINSASSIASVQ